MQDYYLKETFLLDFSSENIQSLINDRNWKRADEYTRIKKQVEKYNKSELENSEQLNILKVNYETIQENIQTILDDLKEYNGIDQKIEELKEKLINNEKDVAKITVVYNDLVVKVQSYQNILEYKEKELSE